MSDLQAFCRGDCVRHAVDNSRGSLSLVQHVCYAVATSNKTSKAQTASRRFLGRRRTLIVTL